MINLASVDKLIMSETIGLDNFVAQYYADDQASAVECSVMRNTLDLPNEYGIPTIQSGAAVHCLKSEIGEPKLYGWFEFDGMRYVIENKVPSQDSNWRVVHCRAEPIP